MTEIRFVSEDEKKEQDLRSKLLEEGGISYYEGIDEETKEKKQYVNIFGVENETYASKNEVEELKENLVLSEVDQEILRDIAENYKLRQPLMIEGDPGVGKTFLLEKFVKFVHGVNSPILSLVCTPRTSELEILGHWSPRGLKKEEEEEYEKILQTIMNSRNLDFVQRMDQDLADLNEQLSKGKINNEEFQSSFGDIAQNYINESRKIILETTQLNQLVKPRTEWEFKYGALLQAYQSRNNKGYPLIVDELNLLPSNYQQIFLQVVGEKGEIAPTISFWGNTGKTVYERGKDTWICFAGNYPEKTPGRLEVVPPLTDRLVWRPITDEETETKVEAIRRTAGGRLIKRSKTTRSQLVEIPAQPKIAWDKVLDEVLGEQIADVVGLVDDIFKKYYQDTGDKIKIKGAEIGRIQQMEFSGRNLLRLYSYLDNFQVRNSETGLIDITRTLENAFDKYYVKRLSNSKAREYIQERVKEILGLQISVSELDNLRQSETFLEASGKNLPPGVVLFEGEVITRVMLFEILVERASMTKEGNEVVKQRKIEYKKREIRKIEEDIEKELSSLLENDSVSEDVKEKLKKIFKD